jgi:hypothetical protein
MTTDDLYNLANTLIMHWANPENPSGMPHVGGQANFSRKGAPCRGALGPGETWTLLDVDGPGTIRRIWITLMERTPEFLRGIVVRMYWDGAETPAVEAPLGDFFCCPLGRMPVFANAWFDTAEGRNFNTSLPMPFRAHVRVTVTNETERLQPMFWYEINYTTGDQHGPDTGYLHAYYRRESPTMLRRDFEIVPQLTGRGRYLGCNLGVIADTKRYTTSWWGEGEVKMYLDGDTEFPTLCGTGTEDYIVTSWGTGHYALPWYGCPVADSERMQFGFYRLHGFDPILFRREIRVTIQQIGWTWAKVIAEQMALSGEERLLRIGDGSDWMTREDIAAGTYGEHFLFERQDDWCATAYLYLDTPEGQMPPIASYEARVAGLTGDGGDGTATAM